VIHLSPTYWARRWADKTLTADNERLTAANLKLVADLAAVEGERDDAQNAYLENLQALIEQRGQIASMRRDIERYDTENMELAGELCDARAELADNDQRLIALGNEVMDLQYQLDKRDAENLALHERAAALTDRVEAYEREDRDQVAARAKLPALTVESESYRADGERL